MAENIQLLEYLLNREKLASLALDYGHNELLLESLESYPGFYEEYFVPTTASEQRPKSVFIVIKNFDVCHEDDFIRMSMHIKSDYKILVDAVLSSIVLFNEPATTIRVHRDDFGQLPALINHYYQEGIKFQPVKNVEPYQSQIKIRRFFDLEVMSDVIYKDLDKADTYYLKVPLYITWEEFEKATIAIRNTFDYKTYDAAQAAIYDKPGIGELVRIYDHKADLSKLQSIQHKYIIEVGCN